jgi:1-acyl-sn-glycerol-3-phosphate acyltransferase
VIIAAFRTVLAYIAVSLYVLIVAPIGMGIALLIGSPDVLYVLGHGGVRLAVGLAGIRVRVVGQLPTNRAAVYCANHQSNVDPPILFDVLHPRMRVLYKHELDKIPLLPRTFRMGGFIPIDRNNREAAIRSIEVGAQAIRDGQSFLIFPEGTRSRTERLLPFKKGGFIMAIRAQAPIVPVAIQGGRDAMRKGSWLIYPATINIQVGVPIETAGYAVDDRSVLIARVRTEIEAMLGAGVKG